MGGTSVKNKVTIAPLLQSFFTDRLVQQKTRKRTHYQFLPGYLSLAVALPGEKATEAAVFSDPG